MNLESAYELFDHLSDGVCLADARGDVLYMNPGKGSTFVATLRPAPVLQ